jgi:hypothetical protein
MPRSQSIQGLLLWVLRANAWLNGMPSAVSTSLPVASRQGSEKVYVTPHPVDSIVPHTFHHKPEPTPIRDPSPLPLPSRKEDDSALPTTSPSPKRPVPPAETQSPDSRIATTCRPSIVGSEGSEGSTVTITKACSRRVSNTAIRGTLLTFFFPE